MKISTITEYRSHWMGIAILWVVLLHSGFEISFAPLAYVRELGYAGVDIFVFASGIGLYHSYTRDHSPIAFLRRRIYRLYPTYLVFMLFWGAYHLIVCGYPIPVIIGNTLAVQGFSGYGMEFNWYITFLVITCILSPFLAAFLETSANRTGKAVLLGFMLLISVPFWESDNLMLVIRLSLFVLGMCFGKLDKEGYVLKKRDFLIILAAALAGLGILGISFLKFSCSLWSYGLYWYPFLLITPGMCTAISLFFVWMKRFHTAKKLWGILGHIGTYSFEIYLLHIFMFELLSNLHDSAIIEKNNSTITIAIMLLVPTAVLLRKFSVALRASFYKV